MMLDVVLEGGADVVGDEGCVWGESRIVLFVVRKPVDMVSGLGYNIRKGVGAGYE